MATFYYNRYSNENFHSQWERYIQNQAYIDDLQNSIEQHSIDFSSIVRIQTQDLKYLIKTSSSEQIDAIMKSTSVVCSTLDYGFELLADNFSELSNNIRELQSELNDVASLLDWKLSLVVEQQRITNLLIGNIAILLKIPDIQKERQYYIEQGVKFLKNAIFNNEFYNDSLNNLLKAEQLEPTDFFTLHRIGIIYLYSNKNLALEKAENYFKKAAKYAEAESKVGQSITKNYLASDIHKNLLEQQPSSDSIKIQAAEAYLFAARTCYIQTKFTEAADLAGKGFSLVPKMVEAGYTQAKALAAANDEFQAAIVLEKVINLDPLYSLKTSLDLDLCTKPSIQKLLAKFQFETTQKANQLFLECKKLQISGSNASGYLDIILELINRNSFLSSKKAIELIDKKRKWNYCEPLINSHQSKYFNEIIEIIENFKSIKYYKLNDRITQVDSVFINSFLGKVSTETQWNFQDAILLENTKPHNLESNLLEFISKEKIFHDLLPSVTLELKKLILQFQQDNNIFLVKLEKEKQEANDSNYFDSILSGIKVGIFGAFLGLIFGFAIGLIFELMGLKTIAGLILVLSIICGGYVGARDGFNDKRRIY